MAERRTPIVMYHSVGIADAGWVWNELVCPVALFEGQLKDLAARGYEPTTLDEVRAGQVSGERDNRRRVVLTFDDGYLDNWVYVYPLLKRAGWKGVVYVNPEFVDPGSTPRPTLEDVWSGRCSEGELETRGFLNWAELALLDRSGVLEIANHSMSHTWYPTGPEVLDFHRPGLSTPWLAWNARPERKPYYLQEDQSQFVPWGSPVHSNGRSLGVRRWYPDPDVERALTEHVAVHGGAQFFDRPNWRPMLDAVAHEADRGYGRAETDDEMMARFRAEILDSAQVLAGRLGRSVPHFCWPGGAYCDEAWTVLDTTNIRTVTIRRGDGRRRQLQDPRHICRISDHRMFTFRGKTHVAHDPRLLGAACDVELGLGGARMRLRVRKAVGAVRSRFTPS